MLIYVTTIIYVLGSLLGAYYAANTNNYIDSERVGWVISWFFLWPVLLFSYIVLLICAIIICITERCANWFIEAVREER